MACSRHLADKTNALERQMKTVICILLSLIASCVFCGPTYADNEHKFVYQNSIPLPAVMIDGQVAKIHSQGLFVTDKHFLVTGRLEKKPKRALLLRFSRDETQRVEYLDITPENIDGETLDHPGGFDIDANGLFQIPLSTSHRRGPAIIQGFRIAPARPLAEAKIETTVKLDDHVGAICCVDSKMLGANWDTLTVHVIEGGALKSSINQQDTLIAGNPMVAVQDWKSIRNPKTGSVDQVVLGGIVKSEKPRATIQFIDVQSLDNHYGNVVETHRFPMRDDVTRPITNEGLALHDGSLYLLPEDIGAGAKVLRYAMHRTQE